MLHPLVGEPGRTAFARAAAGPPPQPRASCSSKPGAPGSPPSRQQRELWSLLEHRLSCKRGSETTDTNLAFGFARRG